MKLAAGRENSAGFSGLAFNTIPKALLPIFIAGLALLGVLAAPAKAQSPDANLLGYAFECCGENGGQDKQFLVLALVVPDRENDRVSHFKYQVTRSTIFTSDTKGRDNMRQAILGRPYAGNSREVRDLQQAVGTTADGGWGNGTWMAVHQYFKNLKEPRLVSIGSRTVGFVPIAQDRLTDRQRRELKEAVEDEQALSNRIPLSVLETFLAWASPAPALPGAIHNNPEQKTSTDLTQSAPAPASDKAQPGNGEPDGLISPLLALVNSVPQNKQGPLRDALQGFTQDEQAQAVRHMALSDAGYLQLQFDLDEAKKAAQFLEANLTQLQLKEKNLIQEKNEALRQHSNLVAQLAKLPGSIKAGLHANGVDVRGMGQGSKPAGLLGNMGKILYEGSAYVSVGRWHLVPVLVLALLSAIYLVRAVARRLLPGNKRATAGVNSYKAAARTGKRPFTENAGAAQADINRLAEGIKTVSYNLAHIQNSLADERQSAENAAGSLNRQAQKLDTDLEQIRQIHEKSIAPLLKELGENIKNLDKGIAAGLAKQGREFKQLIEGRSASGTDADMQKDTNALLESINRKLDQVNSQKIPALMDEAAKRSVEAIRQAFDEIMSKMPNPQKPSAGQPGNAKTGQSGGMDVIRERLGYDR